MARVIQPLNDTQIKKAKAKDKDYTLADGNGLSLLIKKSNSKLWIFRYTSPTTAKPKKTSFGNYPNLTLAEARKKRNTYLELINKNIDPIEHFKRLKEDIKKKNEENKHTIGKISNEYLELKKINKNLKDITIQKANNRLSNHFYKFLPKKEDTNIHKIEFNQITDILKKLESSNKLETLSRVKHLLVEVFKFAYTQSYVKDTEMFSKLELYNIKVQSKNKIKNNPALTKKEDVKRLYKAIQTYKHNLITKYLLLVSIHTAQRQGSIITAKWKNIDFNNMLWNIPNENMKMKISHTLPLSEILAEYLKELYLITGDNEYLFPNSQTNSTRNKYPHISNNTTRTALRKMGFTNEEQTAHGLRATFKTVCKEHQEEYKLPNEFVERILAHKLDDEVEGAYNRALNLKEMRIILNWWSNYLEKLL